MVQNIKLQNKEMMILAKYESSGGYHCCSRRRCKQFLTVRMALKLLKHPLHIIVTLRILFLAHTFTILSIVSAYNEKKVHYRKTGTGYLNTGTIQKIVIIYASMNTV
jgi:hypothetical protein